MIFLIDKKEEKGGGEEGEEGKEDSVLYAFSNKKLSARNLPSFPNFYTFHKPVWSASPSTNPLKMFLFRSLTTSELPNIEICSQFFPHDSSREFSMLFTI